MQPKLDQYYTSPETAKQLTKLFQSHLPEDCLIIEPSAGKGAFLPADMAFDIDPRHPDVEQMDFLTFDFGNSLDRDTTAFVGNPPFGFKGLLALDFVNKCLSLGTMVGFILPIQAARWAWQCQVDPRAKLILQHDLGMESFEFEGKPYPVRCVFQIWTTQPSQVDDLRIKVKPPTSHSDFDCWSYNATKEAMKYWDEPWEFAVPRQGWRDYSQKLYDGSQCDKRLQWMLIAPKTPEARERLLRLDFEALSKLNSGRPGFGKADLVEAYERGK